MGLELNKDEAYEIEKILDMYAGIVANQLCSLCNTAVHMDAVKEIGHKNPLDTQIQALSDTQAMNQKLRDKFKEFRNNG